jgi:hypothetical protein
MSERKPTDADADAINEQMVKQMEERRHQRPERRQLSTRQPSTTARDRDRRRVCGYCFQPGDHPTPAQCLRALERAS